MTIEMTRTASRVPAVLRSVGAVFAGLVTVAALSTATDVLMHQTGVFPPLDQPQPSSTLAIALVYRTMFTVLGGFVAAWLAGRRPIAHAVALGLIGIVLGTLGAIAMWRLGDHWYPIALVVLALPSTWVGGKLFTRR